MEVVCSSKTVVLTCRSTRRSQSQCRIWCVVKKISVFLVQGMLCSLTEVQTCNKNDFHREHPVVFKLIVICMHIHRLTQLLFVFILATGFGLPDHLQALVWILKAHITSSKMYALPLKQQGHKITPSHCHNTYYGIPCTSERYFLKMRY